MLSTDIMQRIILIVIGLDGGSARYAGRCIASVADDAVYAAGRPRCFACSSPRFHDWIVLPFAWFGGYLRSLAKRRAVCAGAKPRYFVDLGDVSHFAVAGHWRCGYAALLVILACLLIFMRRIGIDEKQQKR